ncbi:Peptidoglycan/LPS O-acetylase OafA/YrhL, contains acyltransferase and SGNH-hydrolase domains [Actinokineospora alba]|uniref:Peptidoglycan/LPS O-acetylase OafA/YrhL, contains acyltransferase and SGNH-hydrolase domains n=1 Tax=Actinokineospora alba TaxID=504798 RepID=A0A1H0HBK0_9PSEU|nr:acyltransferase [Actinokineospora alba]TDP64960.1 peptidoglycan/LPS O-acetylase OafA/YrhL [Actinokineospora alba]SDH50352.1 Peptidoglycan/LPS O-acetylase OafA/YrhL, contains acyltransferase and SGNH-hydrolase domains [Actinokineospora alba]SDO16261.1 Peptidoglycan/LPS O-acetylase OafA/YrhL, contains acyltransferase and SGNH-hydrolase domains [Actinokineospora alba]
MPHSTELPARADITGSRLPSLTGLRFIAALMVFLFHGVLYAGLFASPGATETLGAVVGGGGWTGVSFFFILSGFVLTWSVRSADTVRKFYRRRLFKIFPNHLVTAVIAFVLLIAVTGAAAKGTWWYNLLLIQAWFPDLSVLYSGNVVSWSLSCELLFYLAFPALYFGIKRIRPERLWAWTGVVVLAIFLVPSLATVLPEAQALAGGTMMPTGLTLFEQWFVASFPPVRMLEFVFGIFIARIVITGRTIPLSFGGAVALAVAAYALTPLFSGPYRVAATMVVPLGLIIVAGAKVDAAKEGSWLSSRFMVWLGDISFAFYMVHQLVLDYGHRLLGQTNTWSTPVALAVLALLFAGALLAATVLYTCVERPIMRRFASSRRAPRLASVPAASISADPPSGDRLAS